MPVQLPQNVSHLVSSFLGAIGYDHNVERVRNSFCFVRQHFYIPALTVRHPPTMVANVPPSQAPFWAIADEAHLQEVREEQIDCTSNLEFDEVRSLWRAALTTEHRHPITAARYLRDSTHYQVS